MTLLPSYFDVFTQYFGYINEVIFEQPVVLDKICLVNGCKLFFC